MGGRVAVVLREPGGNVSKLDCWTNPLPVALVDPRLYSDNPNVAATWVNDFLGSKERNCAAAPLEYGLLFIDLRDKVILSMQDYCLEPIAVELSTFPQLASMDAERFERVMQLVQDGIIRHIAVELEYAGKRERTAYSIKNTTPDQVAKAIIELARSKEVVRGVLPIAPQAFRIERISRNDAAALYEHLRTSGIPWGATDQQAWEKWGVDHQVSINSSKSSHIETDETPRPAGRIRV